MIKDLLFKTTKNPIYYRIILAQFHKNYKFSKIILIMKIWEIY